MKNLIGALALFLIAISTATAQSVTGTWKTIDDNTGEAKSYIEVYEEGGKLHGKITRLLRKPADTTCDNCPGELKDQPLVGMVVMRDLEPYKDYYSYGVIMDPESGKEYKCNLWLEDANTLGVRGYIGMAALGRTQNWVRVE